MRQYATLTTLPAKCHQAALLAALFAALVFMVPPRATAEIPRKEYVEALRRQGFADWAIDYLKLQLADPNLPSATRADYEYEIGCALVAASDLLRDLSKKGQMLDEARHQLTEFVARHPKHRNVSDALAQIAFGDFQQAQLLVLQAQLPANQGRAVELAEAARKTFEQAIAGYEKARERAESDYKAMPVFIPEDQLEARREKSARFFKYMESWFQSALVRYHLAESYRTIRPPDPDPNDKTAVDAAKARKTDWEKRRLEALEQARKTFEQIYTQHRQEVIGLQAHLWCARCLSALGEYRKAMGIFELLMEHEHDNHALEPFKRDVFLARLQTLAARKEYQQVVNQGSSWLKAQFRYAREPSYLGVEMEVALAHVALGDQTTDAGAKRAAYNEANRLFERLGSFPNSYTNLARREQLRIAELLGQGQQGRSFHQLFSLANARLDKIGPQTTPAERKALLAEAARLFEDAIESARPTDSVDAVCDARLALAYTYFEAGDIYAAAILGEYVAREFPRVSAAPQAALIAVTAYARGYDEAMALRQANYRSFPEVDAAHIRRLTALLEQRWPDAKETVEAKLTSGTLDYIQKNYAAAAQAFTSVNPRSPRYPEAQSLAGRVLWDWYRSASAPQKASTDAPADLRDRALAALSAAAKPLRQLRGRIDRDVFINDAYLADAHYDAGRDEQALAALTPLVDAIEKNRLDASIEPALRIDVLTSTLQCMIRQGKLDESDRLVALIGQQKGQGDSSSVTRVFVSLAARIREQLERLKASGDEQRRQEMTVAFERFLDRIAEREAGQTLQSLVDVAANYIELEKHAKAVGLLKRALEDPQGTDPRNAASRNRARLLLADSYARTGDYVSARPIIDQLYLENRTAKDVMMKRGEILEAAGELKLASAHWKDVIRRMQRSVPRPNEFYEAIDHLIAVAKRFDGDERARRLSEGVYLAKVLLNTDVNLSPQWKATFEQHVKELSAQLGASAP